MRRRISTIAVLLAALGAAALLGCGAEEEEGLHAVEGEPLEVGELRYNVQITRFLNPDQAEDAGYLGDLPAPPLGEDYLAVFIRIQNESEEAQQIPASFPIESNRGETFEPIETENPFALPLGAVIPPGDQLPRIDTAPASGPIKGSMLLYLIEESATENRPLELEISGGGGQVGTIELDL